MRATGQIGRAAIAVCAAAAGATAALVAALATVGESGTPAASALTALYLVVAAGAPAALYLAGGIGLGRLFGPLAGARDPAALRAGLGLALMLTVSHGL